MKNIKIVEGANYGDEGKGLLTRHFVVDIKRQSNEIPVVIFHNGTAQRGHTVDYNPHFRHIYHHFGCGTADGAPTYFSETFWIHPMEFAREYQELAKEGITPIVYCSPKARVITPFDMLIDHATEAWIALQNGEREYGSCGLGSWCAIESRGYYNVYPISSYNSFSDDFLRFILEETWKDCIAILVKRGVDVEQLPEYKDYFKLGSEKKKGAIEHFIKDIRFFLSKVKFYDFDNIFNSFNNLIFENAQGLGLDINCGSEWHTTSHTGLTNPYNLLKDKENFNAEVCYVSRSYNTRHGIGPLEEEAPKKEINKDMFDHTNTHNEFQGSLRYGYLEDKEQNKRIEKDWSIVEKDHRFTKSIALTHCNEFPDIEQKAEYVSFNPYSVFKR